MDDDDDDAVVLFVTYMRAFYGTRYVGMMIIFFIREMMKMKREKKNRV